MELQMNEVTVSREIAGRTLSLSTGLMAKQAAGSCMVRYADTVVISAVASGPPRSEDNDFFPLAVDYREKTYAAGKFPGGFFKREKAPSAQETLVMRLTDRPIRPLFPKGFRDDTVIQSIVLSSDMENPGDMLSMIGASASLALSSLPFLGPIGAVRVGLVGGEIAINPTNSERKRSDLDLVVAGTQSNITMVEAGANEVPEDKMLAALEAGHAVIKTVCEMIEELCRKAGKTEKAAFEPPAPPSCLETVRAAAAERIKAALVTPGKHERSAAVKEVFAGVVEQTARPEEEGGPTEKEVKSALQTVRIEVVRGMIKAGTRIDGRDLRTVRPIDVRLSLLPRVHGSALFTRGETQALVSCTLGTSSDRQLVDGLHEEYEEAWYLHYQAPGFSVGEARMPRGPSRRDIGHGMLAQRALQAVMPSPEGEKAFPYTIRAVSEILEMNGSSSMATVCGATMALMDAGVPIRKPVAGIAMGLIQDEGETPVVITDILGDEDHYGDMDFKVCGTEAGVTALQMDIKVTGIAAETMKRALEQALEGRLHILGRMTAVLAAPRAELSERAPRIHMLHVDPDLIGKLIGKGGETIRAVQDATESKIEIEDDGTVNIYAVSAENLKKAVTMVEELTATPEIGCIYKGRVTSVREFGAFVEILPGTEGLCHVSELSEKYVEDIDKEVTVGDEFEVKVIDIDTKTGKIRLSRRQTVEGASETPPERPGGSRGGGRHDSRGSSRRDSRGGRDRGGRDRSGGES